MSQMFITRETKLPRPKGGLSGIAAQRQRAGVLFALPAILGFFIFTIGPMIASLLFSFTDYNIISTPTFIGFDNYVKLFTDQDPWFFASVSATLKYVVLAVPANLLYSFGLALLLNREMKCRALFRSIFYIPCIVPVVASSFVWMLMMNSNYGVFNMVLRSLGLPKSMWIYDKATVIPSIVFMGLFGTGSTMVIFLAGLQNIPRHFYEAIDVDGGNAYHKFVYITLPMITPTLFFNGIMGMIGAFQVFGTAYIMTEGGPNNASLFYVYNLWRTAFTHMEMGLASAEAWILFIVVVVLSTFVMRTSKYWVYYEGGAKNMDKIDNKKKVRAGHVIARVVMYVFLIALSAFYLLPMYWMLRSSFMTSAQIASIRPYIIWPSEMLWKNYSDALTYVPFLLYLSNTLLILILNLGGTLLTSTLAAYSFARIDWRRREFWFSVLMTGLMLPYAVTLIPTYLAWGALGGVNTFWPLTLPAFFGGGIFNIFLLRQFYSSIPKELDEAAFVDGASHLQIYAHIIVPLSKPAVIVVALFRFLDIWNEYFGPILYLNDPKKFTLAIGLLEFQGQYSTKWNLVMAASTVVILPCLIVFLFGQKQLIEGIALTGLKG